MSEITVRTATLDDTAAIVAVHVAHITRWQRLTAAGEVEDVPYERLTVHERWLHGGPWLSVETCAVHLTHLHRGAVLPLVALRGGQVVGYAECYDGQEPAPFGHHVQVGTLAVHGEYAGQGVEAALLAHVIALGREWECERVCLAGDGLRPFYEGDGWRELVSGQRVTWPARTGQVFYQSTPHPDPDPAQVRGWVMPLGRERSAHQEWVMRWPELWVAVPELREQRVERLRFTVAGNTFFMMYVASPYDPRQASVFLWTAAPFTGPMLTAINDKAHKLGFRRLDTFVIGERYAFLGPDAEPDYVVQTTCSIEL